MGRLNSNRTIQYTTKSIRVGESTTKDRKCAALVAVNVALVKTAIKMKILDDDDDAPKLDFVLFESPPFFFPSSLVGIVLVRYHTDSTNIADNILPRMIIIGDGTTPVLLLQLGTVCTMSRATPCAVTIASPTVKVLGR